MALNTQNQTQLYAGIKEHLGHTLVAVAYGNIFGADAVNVAIECEDCGLVLLDADNPEETES